MTLVALTPTVHGANMMVVHRQRGSGFLVPLVPPGLRSRGSTGPLSSCGDTHGRRYNQYVSTAPSEVRPMTVDELKAAALRLAPQARANLARELLSSLDELSEAEIEQLWFEEAARRDRELDAGTVQSLPADEVLARAKARRG